MEILSKRIDMTQLLLFIDNKVRELNIVDWILIL